MEIRKYSRSLQTAKFKRDYVTVLAVVIFFCIVISELTLAISIPVYFVRSDLWAVQLARQSLHRDFDLLRYQCRKLEARGTLKDSIAGDENQLVMWNLNMMAHYLREHRDTMSAAQAAAIARDLKAFSRIHYRAGQNRPYNRIETLDYNTALDRLAVDMKKEGTAGEE